MSPTVFLSPRLRCRHWRPDDLTVILEVYGDADAMRWVGDGSPLLPGEARRWLDVTAANYERRGYGMFALEDRATGRVVGFAGLVHPDDQREAEVKYAFARDVWGRGLATEAVERLLACARTDFGLDEVIATVAPENVVSQRVLTKAGLQRRADRVDDEGTRTWVYGTVLAPPYEALTEASYARAVDEVAAAHPVLAGVVARWGLPPFWRHPEGFAGLVHGILAQQVSLESAVAAFAKLEAALGRVEPARFLTLDDAELRAIGFSRQKAVYVRGLAQATVSGALDLLALDAAPDDEVRDALLQIKGIGRWTADVYLLFALKRPDAWPSGDLALAKAVQELYGFEALPTWDELDAWADRWRPWRAVAARFLWHDYLSRRGRVS
jgi:DNA-3-methyladenine glycosylase II